MTDLAKLIERVPHRPDGRGWDKDKQVYRCFGEQMEDGCPRCAFDRWLAAQREMKVVEAQAMSANQSAAERAVEKCYHDISSVCGACQDCIESALALAVGAALKQTVQVCEEIAKQYSDYRDGAQYCARYVIPSLNPTALSAHARAVAEARLKEAEWWAENFAGCIHKGQWPGCKACERLAALRKESGQ